MNLPILQHPTFDITIPSTKEKKRFRPFTVAEEKVLLIAREESNGNVSNAVNLLCDIIRNCCTDDINVNKLATFDVEYIFIKLREHSVGDIIKIDFGTGKDKKQLDVSLKDIKVHVGEHKKVLTVASNAKVQIVLGFPTFKSVGWVESALDDQSRLVRNLSSVIKTVIDGDETIDTTDATDDDMIQFINSLPLDTMKDITDWIDKLPYVCLPITRPDGTVQEVRGIQDFFLT